VLINEEFRKCVTYLFINARNPDTNILEKRPVGTAFFVDVVEGAAKRIYVVTARHVIDQSESWGPLFMRLNTMDGGYRDIEIAVDGWTLHESTDVAITKAIAPRDALYDVLSIPHGNLLTDEGVKTARVGIGDEVFFTGLFSEHPGRDRVRPIVRFGNIAMMPEEPIKVDLTVASSIDAYLIEARSWGGHSGSPAFIFFPPYREGNSLTVTNSLPINTLGLVHGHHEIKQDLLLRGDILEGDLLGSARVPLNAGIASVVPAQKILDLLLSL
jgi:hypothetical protein